MTLYDTIKAHICNSNRGGILDLGCDNGQILFSFFDKADFEFYEGIDIKRTNLQSNFIRFSQRINSGRTRVEDITNNDYPFVI
jgi:hypothetical protein